MTAVVTCIIVGPLSRLAFSAVAGNPLGSVLPMSCLDTLGLGALLALRQGKAQGWWLPAGVSLFAACQVFRQVEALGWVVVTFEDLGLALACGWVVARAAEGRAGRVLSLRPLLYLGTISYGLYVFHNFMPPLLADIRIPFAVRPIRFLLLCGVTVVAASLSWYLFERPLGRLKRHFSEEVVRHDLISGGAREVVDRAG
jgi:peptidoglycan/LPS O-acetylase OafA/YrhL